MLFIHKIYKSSEYLDPRKKIFWGDSMSSFCSTEEREGNTSEGCYAENYKVVRR
jgi:hypothetical protein